MTQYIFSGTQTFTATAYSLAPDDELDVLAGATMTGQFDSGALIIARAAHIDNRGAISGSNQVIQMQAGSLTNSGTIVGHAQGSAFSTVEFLPDQTNATAFLFNSGSVLAENVPTYWHYSSTIYGTAIRSAVDITVVNTGTINAAQNTFNGGLGIDVAAGAQATIVNYGQIYGYASGTGVSAIRAPGGANVLNEGSISGGTDLGGGTLVNNGSADNLLNAHAIENHGSIWAVVNNLYVPELAIGGTAGDDTILNQRAAPGVGGTISGSISLGDGADVIDSREGSIQGNVDLGAGNDLFDATGGSVSNSIPLNATGTAAIIGGAGNDIIFGGTTGELVYGDNVSGDTSGGNDTLSGGWGNDVIYGGYGNDTILGNRDADTLMGNQGDDFIHGGLDNDVLYGGQGNDVLNGGVGDDRLNGNRGSDTFVFSANFGHDVIADFGAPDGASDSLRFEAGTLADYADVQAHMVQHGSDVLITLDAANSIRLLNTSTAALSADNFLFG